MKYENESTKTLRNVQHLKLNCVEPYNVKRRHSNEKRGRILLIALLFLFLKN